MGDGWTLSTATFDFLFRGVQVDRVSGAVGIQCLEKGLTILVEKESNDPLVLVGDKFRLEHVVANLVSNAIKFSRQVQLFRV